MLKDNFLDGQTAIITGGGTGLGRALADRLGDFGANLVLAGRREEVLDQAARELRSNGRSVLTVVTDVRDPQQAEHMVAAAVETFGRVDVLVNNAAGNFVCPAEALSVNGWNAVINIVLNGTFYCSSAAGKVMIQNGGGHIINILASYAWASEPGVVHSASAKAGVLAMTRTLAVEWAKHNVRVNGVCPGAIRTEGTDRNLWGDEKTRERMIKRIPMNRFGTPDEPANTVLFLLSEYAAYITGEVITVDGGGWLGRGTFEMVDVDDFGG